MNDAHLVPVGGQDLAFFTGTVLVFFFVFALLVGIGWYSQK